jgi:hypothetical protein
MLDEKGIVLAYSGSLQYHDPFNLDIDLTLFSMYATPTEQRGIMFNVLEPAFQQNASDWPRGEVELDIGHRGLDELKAEADEFELILTKEEAESRGNFAADRCAELISSALVFPDQQELYEQMQKKSWELLATHPRLRAATMKVLTDTIDTREERRAMLRSQQ